MDDLFAIGSLLYKILSRKRSYADRDSLDDTNCGTFLRLTSLNCMDMPR